MKFKFFFWALVLISYIAFIFFLCLHDFSINDVSNVLGVFKIPSSIYGIPIDKYIHFSMFFPLPIFLGLCLKYTKISLKGAIAINLFIGIVLALSSEAAQYFFTKTRQFDKYDLVADVAAICMGIMVISIFNILPKK